ncbi:MAG: sugar phosphate isomerase/epimerase [Anaerolineae bacterium]|nr:sugar phosphate isomerase/epimerase [Anaerolineae bacterium]
MRFGGPIFNNPGDPDEWVAALRNKGYSAAYCPVAYGTDGATIRAYAQAAGAADIVIAEVGAWSNPISPDDAVRQAAIEKCQQHLALADEIGAICCVNITGARGEIWDGPYADNLTDDTFDLIVETVQHIIDAVKPVRTFYTLETMPWAYPDSPDSYLSLLKAIDRPQLAAHLDPVNMISSPQRFLNNTHFLRECFQKLGPYIKSCHGKDITLSDQLTVHLDEVRPGLGSLDYRTLLREMNRLPVDTPLMLEHLETEAEYAQSAAYVRQVARDCGVAMR